MNGILRHQVLEKFNRRRRQATTRRWWRRLRGQPQTLLPLAPFLERLPGRQPRPPAVRMAPLAQIAGSVARAHEYDRQFRPLNDGLRERWVDVYLLNQTIGWQPVELLQVGNLYFVVDGHHRISVARQSGLPAIEARVTAYPLPVSFDAGDSLATALARLDTYLAPRPLPPAPLPAPPALAPVACSPALCCA